MPNKGFLLVLMQPPPAFEEEFNAWYDAEHIPERCATPGFETGNLSGWTCDASAAAISKQVTVPLSRTYVLGFLTHLRSARAQAVNSLRRERCRTMTACSEAASKPGSRSMRRS